VHHVNDLEPILQASLPKLLQGAKLFYKQSVGTVNQIIYGELDITSIKWFIYKRTDLFIDNWEENDQVDFYLSIIEPQIYCSPPLKTLADFGVKDGTEMLL